MKELLTKFQEFTLNAAACPMDANNIHNKKSLDYISLAIGEETGEVLGKLKKNLRDDDGIFTDEFKKGLAAELGDCIYYISQLCNAVKVSLYDIFNCPVYHTYMRPGDINKNIYEHTKDLFAYGNGIIYRIRSAKFSIDTNGKYLFSTIVPYIGKLKAIANCIGYDIEKIIEDSIEKVRSRIERGVVNGSGDNR